MRETNAFLAPYCVLSPQEYLVGFKHTGAVMKRAYAIERIAYEFALDSFADNVRYVEVRFAPQLHAGSPFRDIGASAAHRGPRQLCIVSCTAVLL